MMLWRPPLLKETTAEYAKLHQWPTNLRSAIALVPDKVGLPDMRKHLSY